MVAYIPFQPSFFLEFSQSSKDVNIYNLLNAATRVIRQRTTWILALQKKKTYKKIFWKEKKTSLGRCSQNKKTKKLEVKKKCKGKYAIKNTPQKYAYTTQIVARWKPFRFCKGLRGIPQERLCVGFLRIDFSNSLIELQS